MESKLKEIIEILNEDDSAMIPRVASEKDIKCCNADLKEVALPALPADYIKFLKICNGLSWNGLEFYSTDQVYETDSPNGYRLMDIVTMSDDFDARYWDTIETDCLCLGRGDEWYYTYNTESKLYEVRDLTAISDVYEEYETFAELFVHEVGGRLGLFSGT